ncbi:MAG: glycosyltransferase [Candidatus Lindowbacteria bacterium]|nr:glycosyltransferase [Candidatus Lindowbacteria bacterium]
MISVVVPVYNGERTIEACLKSLANQTISASDYEIVVVNDGSTDRTE